MATTANGNKNPQQDIIPSHQSDAKKIVDRHMADPNHVISEEEMRSIRVGVDALNPDETTEQAIEEAEADKKIADSKADSEEDTTPGSQKVTPWDVVE